MDNNLKIQLKIFEKRFSKSGLIKSIKKATCDKKTLSLYRVLEIKGLYKDILKFNIVQLLP